MKRIFAIAMAVELLLHAGDANAQQRKGVTGIDQIHAQVRVGGKVCMASHEHAGEGSLPSRGGAEGAAIRHWQVFTADEYGSAWGDYGKAVGKRMSCRQGGSGWICMTTARPCRSGR